MDVTNAVMFGFVGLLALNYTVPRVEAIRRHPPLFWGINTLNAVAAIVLLLFGVPGYDGHPLVRFLIGLVILMHLAQNVAVRSRWDAEDRYHRLEQEHRERRAADPEE